MCSKIEHHIISPHRDDALLTFGGFMLSRAVKKEKVFIHLIYGRDGYMMDAFTKELKKLKLKHPHLQNLSEILGQKAQEKLTEITDLLILSGSEDKLLRLGILIRSLEEEAVVHLGGFNLIDYNLPCGFPLRGYSAFNSPLAQKDANQQKKLVWRQIRRNLGFAEDKQINLYFPAGIGGHPDHLILAKLGQEIENKGNAQVIFGQDLLYALVPEWHAKSNLDFDTYQKRTIDITPFYEQKMELLSLYQSQLSSEDLRLAKIYPYCLFALLNRDYLSRDMKKFASKNMNMAIEVQYQKI